MQDVHLLCISLFSLAFLTFQRWFCVSNKVIFQRKQRKGRKFDDAALRRCFSGFELFSSSDLEYSGRDSGSAKLFHITDRISELCCPSLTCRWRSNFWQGVMTVDLEVFFLQQPSLISSKLEIFLLDFSFSVSLSSESLLLFRAAFGWCDWVRWGILVDSLGSFCHDAEYKVIRGKVDYVDEDWKGNKAIDLKRIKSNDSKQAYEKIKRSAT